MMDQITSSCCILAPASGGLPGLEGITCYFNIATIQAEYTTDKHLKTHFYTIFGIAGYYSHCANGKMLIIRLDPAG